MHGNAKMTGGRLMKKDLKYNKAGKIVSKKMSKMAKKEMRLQKAGYKTQKGVFQLFQKQMGGNGDEEEENESKAEPPGAPGGSAAMAPPGGSAAMALPNLNELKTSPSLLIERAIDKLAKDIKTKFKSNKNIDTIKKALKQHNYNIDLAMNSLLPGGSAAAMAAPGGSVAIPKPQEALLNRFKNTFIIGIKQYLYDILKYDFSDEEIIEIAQILLSKYNNTPILAYQFIINTIRGEELNTTINKDYISYIVDVTPSLNYNTTIKIKNLFSNIKEGRLVDLQLLRDQRAMAPGGSAAMAIPNLNELITRASLLKKSIKSYSNNKKERAINTLAEDIKKLYFKNIDIDTDTIKKALKKNNYDIDIVIVNLVTTKINTARQQFNLTKRHYTNQNKEKIINKIKANTPIGEIIGPYLDFST